jgi:CheY-like chemotaxis protein
LVEDDATTVRVLARPLRKVGHEVTTANSLKDALKSALGAFDVVVSDIGLPDGSGLDLMNQLRQRHGLVGIALTGFGMDEDVERSRQAGFVDHLTKPVDFGRLDAVVQRVCTWRLK